MTRNSRFSIFLENKTGFTLIELLVSISIIAVLTALLTANFIGARQRGRDGVRKADLRQMQAALELYRTDSSFYPTDQELATCDQPLASGGGAVYMQQIPCDASSGQAYSYIAAPAGCDNVNTFCQTYTLYACLENEQDSEVTQDPDSTTGCDSAGGTSFPFRLNNP